MESEAERVIATARRQLVQMAKAISQAEEIVSSLDPRATCLEPVLLKLTGVLRFHMEELRCLLAEALGIPIRRRPVVLIQSITSRAH